MLLFLPDRVGVDRGGAQLRMTEPALEHMERDALYCGMHAEPMTQALRAAVRRIRNSGLDHHALDDLPDADAAEVPDRGGGLLSGLLGLPDPVGGGQSIEEFSRDRHGPEDDLLLAGGVFTLLQGPDRDGPAGEVNSGRRDLQELGRPAPGPMERLTQGPVPRGLTPGRGEERAAFLSVQIKPVSGGVMEAHFAHV